MRKMKRVSIALRHREVTITMEGSALHGTQSQSDHESSVTVCPTCGNRGMKSAAWSEGDLAAHLDRIQRAREQPGLHRQDAVVTKPAEVTGCASPDNIAS
jgi:hypothetical protein